MKYSTYYIYIECLWTYILDLHYHQGKNQTKLNFKILKSQSSFQSILYSVKMISHYCNREGLLFKLIRSYKVKMFSKLLKSMEGGLAKGKQKPSVQTARMIFSPKGKGSPHPPGKNPEGLVR